MPNDVDRPLTPSELLVAAADRIRDLAEAAGEARGVAVTARAWAMSARGRNGDLVVELPASEGGEWIAALSPAIAPHLETCDDTCWLCVPAVAFARAVVGEGGP